MSADAPLELLRAVRAALVADATIAGHVGNRVATDWGSALAAPFIRLSVPDVRGFETDCGDGSEYTLRVHVFAKDAGPVMARTLASRVRTVLANADLVVDGAALWWITFDQTISQLDRDDPTLRMSVVTFKAATTEDA